MSIQSDITGFTHGGSSPPIDRYPDPPDDDELDTVIAPAELYDFPVNQVTGIDDLRRRLRDIIFYRDDPLYAWSMLLGEYISYGNKKVAKTTAIFNVGSAHDCPNLGTPACQVDEDECYAARSEDNYPEPLDYRRKQAIIFSLLDAYTWARAFRQHYERKQNTVDSLRFNESGDFKNRHQILKLETISSRLSDIVDTYTYSASADLPWEEVTTATVNQSNDFRDFGAREYKVVDTTTAIPDDGIRCPNDLDESIKCGDCKLCITDGADDIYVKNFYADADTGTGSDSDIPPISAYTETIATALPDGWEIQSLEQELNTTRDKAVLFDGVLTHNPSNSIVQIVPSQTDRTDGYDANRIRVQNNVSHDEYYVGLSSATVDLPADGVTAMDLGNIGTSKATDRDQLLEHADFPAQHAVHSGASTTTTDTETTFWTPDMAVIATLVAVRSVSATIVTQSALSAF